MARFIKIEMADPVMFPYAETDNPRQYERWVNVDLVQYIYTDVTGYACVKMLGSKDPLVVTDSLDILRAKLTMKGE